MYVLIRTKKSGIVSDVEIFGLEIDAINWAVEHFASGPIEKIDMREHLMWSNTVYEDTNFLIEITQKELK